MQGVEFVADMLILPLGGCDAVLGIQWLVTLGVISAVGKTEGMIFNVEQSGKTVPDNAELTQLLQEFADLFEEPHTLPPQRTHDHGITLKEGTNPISVRPYRRAFRSLPYTPNNQTRPLLEGVEE
ncbi:hypothetical protein BUALT_Bualt11G0021500 [Buddleja alternifolia]|uniref:Uncharacterized protein n=1 Tax=Buddleja alternifolia TaxID=168488 RepID=A0AAV6WZ54_9LAMI|nr:hypothetical protein BUALT_Bualt11G0021500 [Buddleja alternifolia]